MARHFCRTMLLLLAGCFTLGALLPNTVDAKKAADGVDKSMGYLPKSVPWKSLADVRDPEFLAKNDRPIMYLVSREGCPACNALKASVNAEGDDSESIKELADEFVMVAVSEAEANASDEVAALLNPGGKHAYVPRVLFASADNVVAKKANNKNTKGAADPKMSQDFKYFYPDAESLVVGMTTANTHFEDIKIKAKKKMDKKKRLEEEKKNPKKKMEKKKAGGGGGGNGLDGILESIKAQAAAQGANIPDL